MFICLKTGEVVIYRSLLVYNLHSRLKLKDNRNPKKKRKKEEKERRGIRHLVSEDELQFFQSAKMSVLYKAGGLLRNVFDLSSGISGNLLW